MEIEINGVKIIIEQMEIPGHTAFRASFSSKRQPIVIARARDIDENVFWTSIPEGRKSEATAIGKIIEENWGSELEDGSGQGK